MSKNSELAARLIVSWILTVGVIALGYVGGWEGVGMQIMMVVVAAGVHMMMRHD